jgi:hypothetical protein
MAKLSLKQAAAQTASERSYDEIKAIYLANAADPSKGTYDGLTTAEIATWNRRMMPGYLGT